jgi:hypothetical protein
VAQHDYVIANGTGAAVRSDLNNALAAIVSQNSGATEPATMYAYQWWADTSTGLLKLRNAANNAWITLRELDGTLTIEAGTVSAPGLAFASDLNTGVFSEGADQLAIATNGVERVEWGTSEVVFNDGGANYDFRIEGDTNSSLFFVDASAEAVGIGSTAAPGKLTVSTTSANPSAGLSAWSDGYSVVSPGGTSTSGGIGLSFDTSGNTGSLSCATPGSAWRDIIYTANSHRFNQGASEFARITSDGKLLVGTSTARANMYNGSFAPGFQIESVTSVNRGIGLINNSSSTEGGGDPSSLILARSGGTSTGSNTAVSSGMWLGNITFQGSDGTEFVEAARVDAYVDGTPGANDMPGRLVFSTCADGSASPTERARITSGGNLLVGTTSNINFEKLGVIQAGNGNAAALACTDASLTQTVLPLYATRDTANNTYYFLQCINSTTATNKLLIADSGNVTNANNSYTGISDIKLKENIADANSQWSDIRSLQVRNYNFKEETGQATHRQIGLIAQEVEQICPNLVDESFDRDAEGNDLGTVTKSVNYSVLYMKAVKALQEAMERIEVLEQRLTDAGIA